MSNRSALPLIAAVAASLLACSGRREPPRSPQVPLAELEATYGRLITAGNHPTPYQSGTGDRVGFFLGANGTIWGLPLTFTGDGAIFGCAPSRLQDARVTDTYPAGATIIGAMNEPTGWRGGTGKLELLMRVRGDTKWRAVSSAQTVAGPACWAQQEPGPSQILEYYRLAPAEGSK